MQNVSFKGWGSNSMGAKFEGLSEKGLDNPEKKIPTYPISANGSAPLEIEFETKFKSKELYEGEAQDLLKIYDEYTKRAGGFRKINGQMVHVTGALDLVGNKGAAQTAIAIEKRLKELGVI